MIVLYTFISEEKHQDLLDRYLSDFPEDFRLDILKYRRWQDAQLSLLGRVLLKHGLRSHYRIDVADVRRSADHKPYLKGQNLHFNISHSKDLVVCAIAEFPLGIDVEFIDKKISYLDFQFQMTMNEFSKIDRSEDQIRDFFGYWTQKESVMKAHGGGMMIPLDSFEIVNNECVIDGKKYFTKDIFIDENYQSCIASDHINFKNEDPLFFIFPI
ncbi:MAG: 4'-phosphopantetheinyl transferase superfamily protein [Chryseobacterium sp.]|jgi:4'-phosphopantetheinyl transferase|uniref:4'-phosphopantetheinyl transferase family protein n=1 Tax=Chryseobacterium sp. TaxID=1871047 RepID=UPI00282524CC|nr:4'-phosphopantetheinyl transferase superfamily protein [Chryseobacterium sp.]MDR2238615.1 4'-phosphopantetheinyl transferase superfamily protein [Chryseobacterium sp.]